MPGAEPSSQVGRDVAPSSLIEVRRLVFELDISYSLVYVEMRVWHIPFTNQEPFIGPARNHDSASSATA